MQKTALETTLQQVWKVKAKANICNASLSTFSVAVRLTFLFTSSWWFNAPFRRRPSRLNPYPNPCDVPRGHKKRICASLQRGHFRHYGSVYAVGTRCRYRRAVNTCTPMFSSLKPLSMIPSLQDLRRRIPTCTALCMQDTVRAHVS